MRDGRVKVHLKIPGKTLASPPALVLLGVLRSYFSPTFRLACPYLNRSCTKGLWKVTGVSITNYCRPLLHRGSENSLQMSLSIYEDFPLLRRYLVKR